MLEPTRFENILANARSLVPFLKDRAPDCEEQRQLTPDVVDALRQAGVFRMLMPRSWGGPELSTLEQIEVIEEVSRGDASAGWCAMIGSDSGLYSGFVEDDAARRLWPRLDMAQSGWIHPVGRADVVPGGYRVSGEWMFCSGSTHADNVAAGCLVYSDGQPLYVKGRKQWRLVVAPAAEWVFEDNWHTTGLKATASRDYTTRGPNMFVPEEHCFSFLEPKREGTLWARPDALLRKMAGVPLGLARGVLEEVSGIVAGKIERPSGTRYSDLARVRTDVAEAQMLLGAARSYVFRALETQWRKIERNEEMTARERADVWLSRLNAFQVARAITRRLYDTIGGSAIFTRRSGLCRALRDAETMCQHVVGQRSGLARIGGLLLGDPREDQNVLVPR